MAQKNIKLKLKNNNQRSVADLFRRKSGQNGKYAVLLDIGIVMDLVLDLKVELKIGKQRHITTLTLAFVYVQVLCIVYAIVTTIGFWRWRG